LFKQLKIRDLNQARLDIVSSHLFLTKLPIQSCAGCLLKQQVDKLQAQKC